MKNLHHKLAGENVNYRKTGPDRIKRNLFRTASNWLARETEISDCFIEVVLWSFYWALVNEIHLVQISQAVCR
jgi:hypothetical protein